MLLDLVGSECGMQWVRHAGGWVCSECFLMRQHSTRTQGRDTVYGLSPIVCDLIDCSQVDLQVLMFEILTWYR